MTKQQLARFGQHIDRNGPNGCWVWTGCRFVTGYGKAGRNTYAHRLSYEMAHGPIPAGLMVHHTCRNRACVNPAHLEAVTIADNVLMGDGISARNARKTHCPQGHAYTPDNTYWSQGKRHCRQCCAARQKACQLAVPAQTEPAQ